MDQLRRELASDAAPLRHRTEPQAYDPDVDGDRLGGQPLVLVAPVIALDRLLEAAGDDRRLGAAGQIGNQETELVAAEPGVQIARLARAFEREEILGADLVREDPRDPLDDAVAERMPERVVVPLEAGDIDDADARTSAPAARPRGTTRRAP